MDYKTLIMELISQIDDEMFLQYIYDLIYKFLD